MKKSHDLSLDEIRALVRSVLEEDMKPTMTPAAHAMLNTGPSGSKPAGAPGGQPAGSTGLPQNNALGKFKADVNMAVDAANKVKENVDQANTKEALRWLDKMIAFATSAKGVLGVK